MTGYTTSLTYLLTLYTSTKFI